MFVTGPAGAGKCKLFLSECIQYIAYRLTSFCSASILNALIAYVSEFSRSIGHIFDKGVIRLSALTGSAATEICGNTTHRECKIGSKTKITQENIEQWLNTRMLIIDEVSFAGYEEILIPLSKNLKKLTGCTSHVFGSVPLVFIGDFFQLEAMTGTVIYKKEESLYWMQALNKMVELKGEWRYKDCPILKNIFAEFRREGLSANIRKKLNERVIKEGEQLPNLLKTQMATYSNREKEKYNDLIFNSHLEANHSKNEERDIPECTVLIKGDPSWSHNRKPFSFNEKSRFFNNCREHNTRARNRKNKRVSPILKLWNNCKVMYLDNDDVGNGVANGTEAEFKYVVLKEGKKPKKTKFNGYWVWSVYASDIKFMVLEWSEDSPFTGQFLIVPKELSCVTKIEVEDFGMKKLADANLHIIQFPITLNHATTGHKLQGKSVDDLFVCEFTNKVKNWLYVVLSRVRTFSGLYLAKKIPPMQNTGPDEQMKSMMATLRRTISPRNDSLEIAEMRSYIINNANMHGTS